MAKSKAWKDFEIAVAQFIAALDPNAVVKHNVYLPDKHTGHPRQRDVWIEAMVCRLFPVKILVSCKRLSEPINEQDMDAFVGELQSSGAHKGVLYSFSGYTSPAIKKATVLGICCCKLYDNQPPDLPEILLFKAYCCAPSFKLILPEIPDPEWGFETWNDLFALQASTDEGEITLLDHLAETYREGEKEAISELTEHKRFPPPWHQAVRVVPDEAHSALEIVIEGTWRVHPLSVLLNITGIGSATCDKI